MVETLLEGRACLRPEPRGLAADAPLFALRSFTCLGWIGPRLSEPSRFARLCGIRQRALQDAGALLASNP